MTRVTMFGGKGGVGKSTCAGIYALHQALGGKKTLVLSTDATPSLAHLFDVAGGKKPTWVRENLYFLELGLDTIKKMWDERFGEEVYEVFSAFVEIEYAEFVDFITSILPGLKEEFMVEYIRERAVKGEYEVIVWDTAPLGETLGLLKMPALISEHLKAAPRIYSRLIMGKESRRPLLHIIKSWEALSNDNIQFLQQEVHFIMVTIPAYMAVKQLEEVLAECKAFQLPFSQLIINQLLPEDHPGFLREKRQEQMGYRKLLYQQYPEMSIWEIPAFPQEVRGLKMLEKAQEILFS